MCSRSIFDMELDLYAVAEAEKAREGGQPITFAELNELTFGCCDRGNVQH